MLCGRIPWRLYLDLPPFDALKPLRSQTEAARSREGLLSRHVSQQVPVVSTTDKAQVADFAIPSPSLRRFSCRYIARPSSTFFIPNGNSFDDAYVGHTFHSSMLRTPIPGAIPYDEHGPGGPSAISAEGTAGNIRSREPPNQQQWENFRTIITRLYYDEKRSLEEVRDILQKQYGFHAS